MSRYNRIHKALLLLPAILIFASTSSLAADVPISIGRVLVTVGTVKALKPDGSSRVLKRRSDLFEGETIVVSDDGRAQFRMVDDALISLDEGTRFTFDKYRFDDDPATQDSVVLAMDSGGMRTILGSVGDSEQDEYRLDTPYASLSGASSFRVILEQDQLFAGVSGGAFTVSNNKGSLLLGIGSTYDYASVASGAAPVGEPAEPAALKNFDRNLSGGTNIPNNNPPGRISGTGGYYGRQTGPLAPSGVKVIPLKDEAD